MVSINRRQFLAAISATAFTSMGTPAHTAMANEELRVVVIGLNGIGRTHLEGFPLIPGVRVVGACDVDSAVLGTRAENFDKKFGYQLKTYDDLRRVYDDPNVDAVVLAVPNHWHGLGTVWGCQAGKDVYTEKPCSHNIWEAGQMEKAAQKYERIVQIGIQRRSFPHLQEFFREIREEGVLGKLKSVKGLYLTRRSSIGKPEVTPKPLPTVNHDLWCGPGSTELERLRYHYDWHWFWDYGNAELGNNGPHILDLCRWVVGAEEFPTSVTSVGGRYAWDDNGQTPNTHILSYDYATAPITFEIRDLPTAEGKQDTCQYRGLSYGIVVEGEDATYLGFDTGKVIDNNGKTIREVTGDKGADGGRQLHRENFVKAVRSRKTSDLNCSVKTGHLSSALCHLGNISHQLGEPVALTSLPERVQDQPLIAEASQRMSEHLAANGVNTKSASVQLGRTLKIDPTKEIFPNDAAANQLLRREYRSPYIVPEQV
ncbi:Gfo/Idh/MocA family oxidoreductase [Rubinisphaera sp.]|uniref:Gfo/Idh/MocA family protein n=1 Tax=Rubinisphaera sp. TaxID=2024857 RepID=UPI000C10CDAB|nr:Gfo/Idh/MocA family oxidoreductase [Rubinisphaera sp.]MBV09410.1 dehydrogenase [Rubinisphaera sp.]HCS54057.1 dehydrogenase [Planctomycetaceae bacterium]|tara:strand:- start:1782 stop:3233 length:1452 start_codon:yes stop_codon:yes gene_type:complete